MTQCRRESGLSQLNGLLARTFTNVAIMFSLMTRKQTSWLGWIPGFLGFSNSGNETWIWIAQIIELQKSFSMIPNSNAFRGNWTSEIIFFLILRGRWCRWTWCDKLFPEFNLVMFCLLCRNNPAKEKSMFFMSKGSKNELSHTKTHFENNHRSKLSFRIASRVVQTQAILFLKSMV